MSNHKCVQKSEQQTKQFLPDELVMNESIDNLNFEKLSCNSSPKLQCTFYFDGLPWGKWSRAEQSTADSSNQDNALKKTLKAQNKEITWAQEPLSMSDHSSSYQKIVPENKDDLLLHDFPEDPLEIISEDERNRLRNVMLGDPSHV